MILKGIVVNIKFWNKFEILEYYGKFFMFNWKLMLKERFI